MTKPPLDEAIDIAKALHDRHTKDAAETPSFDAEALARKAINLMMSIADDSFGPTDAVRALAEYASMTPAQREAVTLRVRALCG